MNNCIFSGRLTDRPELKTTSSGKMVCDFTLAVKRNYKNQDGSIPVDFVNFTAWDKRGETISKWLEKGDELTVVSALRVSEYTDQAGNKRRRYNFEVSEFEFGKKAGGGENQNGGSVQTEVQTAPQSTMAPQNHSGIIPGLNARPQKQEQQPATYIMPPSDLVEIGDDEELPF